jgi:hypothetical protein
MIFATWVKTKIQVNAFWRHSGAGVSQWVIPRKGQGKRFALWHIGWKTRFSPETPAKRLGARRPAPADRGTRRCQRWVNMTGHSCRYRPAPMAVLGTLISYPFVSSSK